MKTLKSLLVLALITTCAATHSFAQTAAKQKIVVPLSEPGKPGQLEVALIFGSISVSGHAGKEVIVEAEADPEKKSVKTTEEAGGGMRKITAPGSGLNLDIEEAHNQVKISSHVIRGHGPRINIKVPQQFSVKASTVNNGEISLDNVSGEFEINNVNGPVKLSNVSGSAVVTTVNGNIVVTFKSVNAASPMAFTTLNGNVDVTFPAASRFDLKAKSDFGDIYSDFDMAIDQTPADVKRTEAKGMFKVNIEDWVKGKVNGGGKEVLLKNMHGNLYLRKAK